MALEHLCQKIFHASAEINDARQFADLEKIAAQSKILLNLLQQLPPPQSISAQEDKTLVRKILSEAAEITRATATAYQIWQDDIATLLKTLDVKIESTEG